MRVLHILDHSVPIQSGYAARTLSILKEQRALGWETLHITSPKHAAEVTEEDVEGLHFYRTRHPGGLLEGVVGLAEIELMGEVAHRIEQVVKRYRPHILHSHSPALNAIPAIRVGRRLGIPVVYEVTAFWEDASVGHGTSRNRGLRYRLTRALEGWALRRADAITTVCEGLQKDIVARGIPPEKVTVVPHAANIAGSIPNGLSRRDVKQSLRLGDAPVLGYIGSFHPYEGLDMLVRALPEILRKFPTVRVLLVGEGRQKEALTQVAQHIGVKDSIVFVGAVPYGETARYYQAIDVAVYPRVPLRYTELVTSLKPLEAMAQGCVVAASNVGGHRELVRHGQTGILFRPGDVAALAEAIIGLLQTPERWPLLSAAGRRFIETERTWPMSVARYAEIYARLMKH